MALMLMTGLALPVLAELHVETFTFTGNTNTVSNVTNSYAGRGYLLRLDITETGTAGATGKTNNVIVNDGFNTLVQSGAVVTAVNASAIYTNNPRPYVGLNFISIGANTNLAGVNIVTNKATILFDR
jgi:hypothetical protein